MSKKSLSKMVNHPVLLLVLAIMTVVSFYAQFFFPNEGQGVFLGETQSTLLVGGETAGLDDISVMYKDNLVPSLYSTNVKITFGGVDSIKRDGIASSNPLTILLGGANDIYDVKLIEVSNKNSLPSIDWSKVEGKVYIDFEFFNRADSITVQVLHASEITPAFDVSIIGVKKGDSIYESKYGVNSYWANWYAGAFWYVVIALSLLCVSSATGMFVFSRKKDWVIIGLALLFAIFASILAYVMVGRFVLVI